MSNEWKTDEWEGCYPSNWKGLIIPDAIAHPAKFSSRLIRRIYDHILEEKWVKQGDTILDPFGGVALGAMDSMRVGLKWRGCELEPRFAELGNGNIFHWNLKFRRMPKWSGDAVLYQGDSRHLLDVLRGNAQGAVSSPPYAEARIGSESGQEHCGRGDQYGQSQGQLGAMEAGGFEAAISSPPFAESQQVDNRKKPSSAMSNVWSGRFGEITDGKSDGQLANMPNKDFQAAISSPPFRQSEGGTPEPKPGGVIDERLYARHAAGNSAAEGYGATDGQLANMGEGDFQSAVSSPPFEGTVLHDGGKADYIEDKKLHSDYGDTEGQLGNDSGDDFWLAARQIVEQVYLALEPGGHAVWVCKDFVKDKKRVPFSDQWRQLCEAVGFTTVHEHRALLTKKMGSQNTLEGDIIHTEKKYASFFRRLAESKGSPKIGWETIWCMEKRKDSV